MRLTKIIKIILIKPKGLWTANTNGEKIHYYEAMTERDEARKSNTRNYEA